MLVLLENHCLGKTNIIYEGQKFNNGSQEQTEPLDNHVTALRSLAETRDRALIVYGVRYNSVRSKLLQESELIDICRANEATTAQLKDMSASQSSEEEANTVNQREGSKPGGGGVLPYKGLMGTCGQPGNVFRDFCLKQGVEFIMFCLNQGIGLLIFVLGNAQQNFYKLLLINIDFRCLWH